MTNISVLGDLASRLQDSGNPPGHTVGEFGEVSSVLAELLPGLADGLSQLVKVGAGGHVKDDAVQLMPAVFYWVHITGLTHPIQDVDVVLLKPLHAADGGVTGRPILHEDGAPRHPHAGSEMLPEDLTVHLRVDLLVLGHKLQTADPTVAYRGPNHQLRGKFDCPPDEAWVVPGNGG